MSEPGRMSQGERLAQLAAMTPPFQVMLTRLLPTGQVIPIVLDPLAQQDGGWLSEDWIRGRFGEGTYRVVITDSRGETLQWLLMLSQVTVPPAPPLDLHPTGGVPAQRGHLGVQPTPGTVGIARPGTVIRLPNGEAIKIEHLRCEFFHTQVPWGGSILVIEGGVGEILEALVYGAGVLVPSQASAQHELGDLLVEVVSADGGRHPVLRAPVQALAQRHAHLWNLEEYFAPRSLWQVAAELGARLRQTTVAELAETAGAKQAQENLRSVREYIALVHAEYTAYVAAVGPGMMLPAKVAAGGRLWLTHETTVSRGGQLQQTVEAPMHWSNGFLVESTALVKGKEA